MNTQKFYLAELREIESNTEHIIITKTGNIFAPIDIHAIVKNYGISVSHLDKSQLEYNQIRAKINISSDKSDIYISDAFNEKNQRFLLAHELGHYYAYHKQGLTGSVTEYNNSTNDNLEEFFANQFALSLMIPVQILHNLLRLVNSLSALSETFLISEKLIKLRINSLYGDMVDQDGNIKRNHEVKAL